MALLVIQRRDRREVRGSIDADPHLRSESRWRPRAGEGIMTARPLRHVDLYGPAGRLEALYRELQDPAGIAVVCHPHPSGGGTLHNKVVFRAARGLENANVATLRFNFRGTGASAGKHDEGEGEQQDVMAAIDWARRKHPGKKLI